MFLNYSRDQFKDYLKDMVNIGLVESFKGSLEFREGAPNTIFRIPDSIRLECTYDKLQIDEIENYIKNKFNILK